MDRRFYCVGFRFCAMCVAVCCSVLQRVAVCCSVWCVTVYVYIPQFTCWSTALKMPPRVALQCVAVCCSVLQCFPVCCSVWCVWCLTAYICMPQFTWRSSIFKMPPRVAVCCSVLQCVAVCCSVLQRVAVCDVLQYIHIYRSPQVGAEHNTLHHTRHTRGVVIRRVCFRWVCVCIWGVKTPLIEDTSDWRHLLFVFIWGEKTPLIEDTSYLSAFEEWRHRLLKTPFVEDTSYVSAASKQWRLLLLKPLLICLHLRSLLATSLGSTLTGSDVQGGGERYVIDRAVLQVWGGYD